MALKHWELRSYNSAQQRKMSIFQGDVISMLASKTREKKGDTEELLSRTLGPELLVATTMGDRSLLYHTPEQETLEAVLVARTH